MELIHKRGDVCKRKEVKQIERPRDPPRHCGECGGAYALTNNRQRYCPE